MPISSFEALMRGCSISRYGWVKTPKSQMIERLRRVRESGFTGGDGEGGGGEDPPRAAPVHPRRRDELVRDLRQPRVDRDHDERDRAPDDQRGRHRELRERRREPVVLEVVDDVQSRERGAGVSGSGETGVANQSCWK